MNSIRILCCLKKSFSARATKSVLPLKRIQLYSYKPKYETTFNTKTYVEKDTLLFRLEKPRFFIALYLFSAVQFVTFMYLGNHFFKMLKNPALVLDSGTFWGKVLDRERENSNIIKPLYFLVACATFIGAWLYGFRSVREIILHKGGRQITLVTYGLPGYNTVQVPLANISSMQPRIKAKKFISVKVKNKPFYYIIDVTAGEFLNPVLFDYTAGIKRAF